MARIVSIAELARKPSSGVDFVKPLELPQSYEIPEPLMAYSGPVSKDNREWSDLFCSSSVGSSPPVDLYKINDCLVTVDGAIVTLSSNSIIKESLFPYLRQPDVAAAFTPNLFFPSEHDLDSIRVTVRAFSRAPECLFFAREHGEAGYFHWLHSVLPRVAQYRASELSKRPISLAVTEKFQVESLGLMALDKSDVHLSDGTSKLCSSLYYCTPMVSPDTSRSGGFFERALYASAMLRSLAANVRPGRRKIFISRKDARIRRLVEEDSVVKTLEKHGFESHVLTGMAFKEQVALFASSSVVVSMHGAGLSNVAFMPAGGVVVELLTPDRLWPTFRGVAVRSGLSYLPFVGNKAGVAASRDSDISVEADRFTQFVLDATHFVHKDILPNMSPVTAMLG